MTTTSRRLVTRILIALLLLGLGVVGITQESESPRTGGTLIAAWAQDPVGLDPHSSNQHSGADEQCGHWLSPERCLRAT